jgi:flavorubredoxin
MSPAEGQPLPREIADGVFWLGECLVLPYRDTFYHSYGSVYLVRGEEASLMVETGHPKDLDRLERAFDGLLADGPPLRYLFTTHQELPHAGGLGRWLSKWPEAVAIGDISDYALIFPEHADRLVPMRPGSSVDLGGTEFRLVEGVFRDLMTTIWGFDSARRVLFPGDGFAYSHYHEEGQCGSLAEEVPEIDFPQMASMFTEFAFYWTRFVDVEPYLERMDDLVRDELRTEVIAPTHGLPIGDVDAILPKIWDGLRMGAALAP